MRALIQRVSSSKVTIEGKTVAEIGCGLVVLLGIGRGDTEEKALFLAKKIASMRIFEDEAGKFNLSLLDIHGAAIIVSQFTLYADVQKGSRPSFSEAAKPEIAAPLVEKFAAFLCDQGIPSKTGIFGAHMRVKIENDGPVTIWLEK
jgi:D-tyrosyl-tRNA(Tyr) deacylase